MHFLLLVPNSYLIYLLTLFKLTIGIYGNSIASLSGIIVPYTYLLLPARGAMKSCILAFCSDISNFLHIIRDVKE